MPESGGVYLWQNINNEVILDYFEVSLPDLLIFIADLNVNNKIHCLYIAGLGYFGIGENQKAKDQFAQILAINEMNFGAKSHSNLLNNLIIKETKLVS